MKEAWLTTLQLAQPSSLLLDFVPRPGPVLDLGSSGDRQRALTQM